MKVIEASPDAARGIEAPLERVPLSRREFLRMAGTAVAVIGMPGSAALACGQYGPGGGPTGPPRAFGDTWQWDGSDWQLMNVVGPPPRSYAAMAYDSVRDVLVMFGGFAPLRLQDCAAFSPTAVGGCDFITVYREMTDTWTWDGDSWTQQHPTSQPLPIYGGQALLSKSETYRNGPLLQMAFDEITGRSLLVRSAAQMSWWDGATWAVGSVPEFHGLVYALVGYDEMGKRLVLLGGGSPAPNQFLKNDVHVYGWDGTAWSTLPDASEMTGAIYRQFGGVVYDTDARKLLFNLDGEVWSLRGQEWAHPNGFAKWPLAWGYDRARGQIVALVAGSNNNEIDTLVGSTFPLQAVTPGHTPVYRVGAAAGYHPKHSAVILFGGEEPNMRYAGRASA